MAADQRRKRLNSASISGCNSREQSRMKKKSLGLLQRDVNLKSHISLEWDGNKKNVIAKKEQIGLSWRALRLYVGSIRYGHNILADIFDVPREIFKLGNLTQVLSSEVWQTYLSQNERNYLMQFLPGGAEVEHVVESLLSGENFHFGNPFLKWSASLCSGDLHPDAILQKEQSSRAAKNAHYSELLTYHNDMIGYLLKLKESCTNCQDLEKQIAGRMWSSRSDVEKGVSLHVFDDPEVDNVTATSESYSWAADEIACSSDNQISSGMKGGEFPKRTSKKGLLREKSRNPLITPDDVLDIERRLPRGEKLHNRNIHCSDGARYMSYFKISKKQHELVKNMKQSGKSIQSRSLNRVLGNIDGLHVKPYEVFVEEEQNKLHEHWLLLAKEHLPAAYENWRGIYLLRRKMMKSLEQGMKDKQKMMLAEENAESEKHVKLLHVWKDNEVTKKQSTMEDDGKSGPGSPHGESSKKVNGDEEINPIGLDLESHITTKSDDTHPEEPGYSRTMNSEDDVVRQEFPSISGGAAWKTTRIPHSYYDSAATHECTSANDLSIANSQVDEDGQSQSINLESNLCVGESGKALLLRQSDSGSFGPYQNQYKNELLQSMFKNHGTPSYRSEEKQPDLEFQPPNNILLEDGGYSGHFQEHQFSSLPLEQGRKGEDEVYMQQNASDNIFPDRIGGGYIIPRLQEHLTPVTMQNWSVNSVRMSTPLQSPLIGGNLSSANWFASDHQVRGGWAGSDGVTISTQSIGSGSSSDQSLFNVLSQSQSNHLRSSSPFQSMGSSGHFISSRNYGIVGGGIHSPRISTTALPQSSHPLDYLVGGQEAASSLIAAEDMGWMGIPHQNSTSNDPMEKPYLRSWNR